MTGDIRRPRTRPGFRRPRRCRQCCTWATTSATRRASHGVTVYLLNVLPELRQGRGWTDPNSCFPARATPGSPRHSWLPAWSDLPVRRAVEPFVVLRVAALARRHGCGLIHAAGLKAAVLVAADRGAPDGRAWSMHVHDQISMPGAALRALHRLFSRCHRRRRLRLGGDASGRGRGVTTWRRIACASHTTAWTWRDCTTCLPARAGARGALGLGESQPVLTMVVPPLSRSKGTLAMVRMMRPIVDARPDARLLLVGEGPDRARPASNSPGRSASPRTCCSSGIVATCRNCSPPPISWSCRRSPRAWDSAAIEAQACNRTGRHSAVGGLPTRS